MVSLMVGAMDARRRRRWVWAGAGIAALAASAIVAVRVTSPGTDLASLDPSAGAPIALDIQGEENLLFRNDGSQILRGPISLRMGDHLIASPSGGAAVSFEDGTRADLDRESDVVIAELGKNRRLALGKGRLDVRVAKLGEGRRFQVATPDSTVEVHGTVFSVVVGDQESSCPGVPARTRVQVTEGVVSVDHGGKRVVLRAGESWPCAVPSTPQATTETVSAPMPPAKRPRARVLPLREEDFKRPPALAPEPGSNLAEQNDLFDEAMAAERRKDDATALRKLETLLRRYPGGPLEESARVERRKLLARPGR